ncbi:MAG: NAD(P)(+) transhydrogenase (Re/Si-specific) subunit alpha, partial [Clostridia bacterium]|nr:NAD(P)(+) transhydrogenase (Re/Si-specific) subunit alpha [Clostridia bacterium]
MVIGIPKEIMHGEGRVAATPETVAKLKADGCEVLVEKTAGDLAFFSDEEYAAAGATMIADAQELYDKADV